MMCERGGRVRLDVAAETCHSAANERGDRDDDDVDVPMTDAVPAACPSAIARQAWPVLHRAPGRQSLPSTGERSTARTSVGAWS